MRPGVSPKSSLVRRLTRGVAAPAVVTLVAAGLSPFSTAQALEPTPAEEAVSDIRIGLLALSNALGATAQQPALADDLPLTDLSVRDVLQLDTALGRLVSDVLADNPGATLDTLPGVLTSGSGGVLDMKRVEPLSTAPAGSLEWTLGIDLTGRAPVALTYQDETVRFGAAELTGELAGELTGTIRLRYDDTAEDLREFSVVGENPLTTRVWTRAGGDGDAAETLQAEPFTVLAGFVETQAAGTGLIDSSVGLNLRDVNGRGALTTEDLQLSDPAEMFATATPPGADDVTFDLDLTTDLIPGVTGPQGSITVGLREPQAPTEPGTDEDDEPAAPPYATPVVDLDTDEGADPESDLRVLASLSQTQALAAFTQYATALRTAESAADAELPLLDANVSDLYSPADDLIALLTQQATATITCGAADTTPPTGAPRPGQVQYCQATTTGVSPDEQPRIAWDSPDPGVDVVPSDGADLDATVGPSPTANVAVTGGGGFPTLTVSFDSGEERRTARTVAGSVQALGRAVSDLGLDGTVTYDPAARALEIAVAQSVTEARSTQVATGGTASLAPLTGLTGLCQSVDDGPQRVCPRIGDRPGALTEPPSGDATVTTDDLTLNATFGIGLLDPAPATDPSEPTDPAASATPDEAPVAYVKPAADGLLWQVGSLEASFDDDVELAGRIGFLQTDVDVARGDYSLEQTGDQAARVVLTPGDVALGEDRSVSGAVDVADLLDTGDDQPAADGAEPADPAETAPVDGQVSLRAQARLVVSDGPLADGSRLIGEDGTSGTIDAVWEQLALGAMPTVETSESYDDLRLLDLVPSRNSVMGEGSGEGTLVDPAADFLTQFGIASDAAADQRRVTRQLIDLGATDPTQNVCTAFDVLSATELTCVDGPLAGGGFADGHAYVINGDSEALRDLLLDDLAAVLLAYAQPSPELGADKTLPLVDLIPSEVNQARIGLNNVLLGLQGSATGTLPAADAVPVSSLQEMAAAVPALVDDATVSFELDGDNLLFTTGLDTAPRTDPAPLRLVAGDAQLRVLSGGTDDAGLPTPVTVRVASSSSASVSLGVDLATARSFVGTEGTSAVERITGISERSVADLDDKDAEYGSAAVRTGEGSDLALAIDATTVSGSDDAWVPLADFRDSLTHTRALGEGASAQTCTTGPVTSASTATTAACATVPIEGGQTVALAMEAGDSSGGTGAGLDDLPLSVQFLADGLASFDRTLGDALDGDVSGLRLPLVGADLDAGADIPTAVRQVSGAARNALRALSDVDDADSSASLASALEGALAEVTDAGTGTTLTGGSASLDCATTCDTVGDVDEITIPVTLSGTSSEDAAFDAGPAGVRIDTVAPVSTQVSWTLDVTLGITRGTGPFLLLGSTEPELKATLTAELPEWSAEDCHGWTRADEWTTETGTAVPTAQAGARCIDAVVGTMPAVLVDLGESGMRDASLAVDLVPGDAGDDEGRVYLPAIYDREVGFDASADGVGGLDLYFESFAGEIGFFDTVGALSLPWVEDEDTFGDLTFENSFIDAVTFYNAVGDGFRQARSWLAPLNPVVDTLNAPIPVINDLANLVGAGPVSMLSILVKRYPDLGMLTNLIAFQQLVGKLPAAESGVELVSLSSLDEGGELSVDAADLKLGSCTSTAVEKLDDGTTTSETTRKSHVGAESACDVEEEDTKKGEDGTEPVEEDEGPEKPKTVTDISKEAYIGLPSISMPVLQDSEQVFDLLLGEGDATLLYVDLGHMGFSVGVSRSFGPFMVGPVPVSASIGGEIGLDGRMAFGFDTRGLTQKIEAIDPGATDQLTGGGSVFKDGFYIDDLEEGEDVPEIELTFTVEAGAAVSIGFAEAGIKGGVVLDLGLDAFDPDSNGKIYTDEFAGSSSGPSCAFNVSSGIVFFLQFYFSIDLFLFSIEEEFDIVRSPRITLFEFNCEVEEPELAVPTADGDLRLLIGEGWADQRRAYTSITNEKFTVRQVGTTSDGGANIEVSAFNLVKPYVVPAGKKILVDAGSGNDTVRFYPGQLINAPEPGEGGATTIEDVPFTVPTRVDGGAGVDTIVTGDGPDVVTGGAGNDTVDAGAGDDTVTDGQGGSGLDVFDGGRGMDLVDGGTEADRTRGGPAADTVVGGTGDDVVDGGVGFDVRSTFPSTDDEVIAGLIDSGDLLVGGEGSDQVVGGDGSDLTVGGTYAGAVPATTGATFAVNVTGTADSGAMVPGIPITVPSVDLPSRTAIDAACANQGEVAQGGTDNVTGGGSSDYVVGGGGADILSGGAGEDLVCGRGGDDLLDGDGSDVITLDQGDDDVRGGAGRDRVYGSGGDDTLAGDADDDLARGGEGDDTLAGGTGSDLLIGDAGDDTVEAEPASAGAPLGAGRAIVCRPSTSIVLSRVDLDGDLSGVSDDGQLEGLEVRDGQVYAGGAPFTGVLGGVVFAGGLADLDGNGTTGQRRSANVLGDTGTVDLAGLTGAKGDGDCVLGGEGTDDLDGGAGGDFVDAGAGDETQVRGGAGDDFVRGGDGEDVLHGDTGKDLLSGDAGRDVLFGDADADVLRGSSDTDLLAGGEGGDELIGDGGVDLLVGGNADLAFSPSASDAPGATPRDTRRSIMPGVLATLGQDSVGDDDVLYGGLSDDWVFGQGGDDEVYGGPDDDMVEGGSGADLVQGDDGSDLLVGGSSTSGPLTLDRTGAGRPDGGDTLVGDEGVDAKDGKDVLVGDNARLVPPSQNTEPARTWWARIRPTVGITLFDTATTQSPATEVSGADTLQGGGKDDLLLGQGGDDLLAGGDGNDALEGAAGGDVLTGELGDDHLIGGSWTAGSYDGVSTDAIDGGEGNDLVVGDNGTVTGAGTTADPAVVTLLDAPAPGRAAATSTFGPDALSGGLGNDTVFGQGGDDVLNGEDGVVRVGLLTGAGDDLLEGGAGADTLRGDDGDDALVGGSSSKDGKIVATRTGVGQLDAGDTLIGGTGDDVAAGDNALLAPTGTLRTDGTKRRTVALFDLDRSSARAAAGTSAGDTLVGDAGRDLLFGQGGADDIDGGEGDDYAEGGSDDDLVKGGLGEDDLVGGGSTSNGLVIGAKPSEDRLLVSPTATVDTTAAGLVDGNDTLEGGDGTDVVLGDNGRVTRNGPNVVLPGGGSGPRVVRRVAMADSGPGIWAGSDALIGGAGDDDLYGQFDNTGASRPKQTFAGQAVTGDVLDGEAGDDALIGDQGVDVPTPAASLGAVNTRISSQAGIVTELIRPSGTLVRVVTQTQPTVGGADVLLGRDGFDSLHAGAGVDTVNAGTGDDVVFGGDGADALWGDADHDRIFGGSGDDVLDVKQSRSVPALWKVVAPTQDTDGRRVTVNGTDVLYGGLGHDALQADMGDQGSVQGDRLIDWNASYNLYTVCSGPNGVGVILNTSQPGTVSLLTGLALNTGSVGSAELALVPASGEKSPAHPLPPGTYACETG